MDCVDDLSFKNEKKNRRVVNKTAYQVIAITPDDTMKIERFGCVYICARTFIFPPVRILNK